MRRNRTSLIAYQEELSRKIAARVEEARSCAGGESRDYVAFESGGTRYLIDDAAVSKVAHPSEIVPFPNAKPWAAGVTNVFGAIHVVVDFSVLNGGARTRGGKLVILDPSVAPASALLVGRLLPMAEKDQLAENAQAAPPGGEWIERALSFVGEDFRLVSAQKLAQSKAFSRLQYAGDLS